MTTPITFVTIKWGTKYGADYVNILHDMVRRNLPAGYSFSFICYTDNAAGILSGIETRPLPMGLSGWWNKLYLFKQAVCADGARIIFLDLDIAITGNIADIAAYDGEFAILRDFYNPSGWNSSIMLWRGGFGDFIWQAYDDAGRPDISGGDQVWIERCKPRAEILQNLFPDAFISFKKQGQMSLPPSAKIVCFHGDPKPPDIRNGWVEKVWKIGGSTPANTKNQTAETPIENVRYALRLPFPAVDQVMATDYNRQVCIVGGGASAENFLDELKQWQKGGAMIWALDSAFEKLTAHDIQPDAHVMFSPDKLNAHNVPQQSRAMLFYASQCAPEVFDQAGHTSKRVVLWHALIDGIHALIGDRRMILIAGGATTGLKAIGLAQTLGFGQIHLYGFDSSYPPSLSTDSHDAALSRISIKIDGEMFESAPHLAQQVSDFRLMSDALNKKGIKLSIHGEGLLPYVVRKLASVGRL